MSDKLNDFFSKKKKGSKLGTLIHGIAASQHIDSSGERIIIKNMDISRLVEDGVFNYEHKNNVAGHVVGKIYEAKKILCEEDCENERHRYFWQKVKMPFIYVMGELFDAYGHIEAKNVAALLEYDKSVDTDKTRRVINFSVEGGGIGKKVGGVIGTAIAKRVSITIGPCNKVAVAEKLDLEDWMDESKAKEMIERLESKEDYLDKVFKKNECIDEECVIDEFVKNESRKDIIIESLGKSVGGSFKNPVAGGVSGGAGTGGAGKAPAVHPEKVKMVKELIGSGKLKRENVKNLTHLWRNPDGSVGATTRVGNRKGFIGEMKPSDSEKSKGAVRLAREYGRNLNPAPKKMDPNSRVIKGEDKKKKKKKKLKKTLEAGSSDAAPSTLTQGAALQRENKRKKGVTMLGSVDLEADDRTNREKITKERLKILRDKRKVLHKSEIDEIFEAIPYKEDLIKKVYSVKPDISKSEAKRIVVMAVSEEKEEDIIFPVESLPADHSPDKGIAIAVSIISEKPDKYLSLNKMFKMECLEESNKQLRIKHFIEKWIKELTGTESDFELTLIKQEAQMIQDIADTEEKGIPVLRLTYKLSDYVPFLPILEEKEKEINDQFEKDASEEKIWIVLPEKE